MDVRAFILGAASGVAASALVYWLTYSPHERIAPHSFQEKPAISDLAPDQRENGREGRVDAGRVGAAKKQGGSRATATDELPELENAPTHTADQPNVTGGAIVHAAGPPTAHERPSEGEASETVSDSWPPSRDDRMKEAKDPDWSLYMEQTLSRYLASHPQASHFDFRSVDCRATFCEIQAIAVEPSAEPLWPQILYDVQHQSWSEFDMTMSEGRMQGGRTLMLATFHRMPRG
jgi:hypothetical protein